MDRFVQRQYSSPARRRREHGPKGFPCNASADGLVCGLDALVVGVCILHSIAVQHFAFHKVSQSPKALGLSGSELKFDMLALAATHGAAAGDPTDMKGRAQNAAVAGDATPGGAVLPYGQACCALCQKVIVHRSNVRLGAN